MRLGSPGWGRLGAAFGLGAVVASGQAPLGFWWLALPGLCALVALIARAETQGKAAWLAWFGGAGYFGLALNWIVSPFMVDAARDGWMAPFALVLMAFGLALFWAGAGFAAWRLGAAPGGRALALAVTLALAEMARGHVLTGFPWASLGHVWIGWAPMQVAALLGPDGLTFLTTLAAALPLALRPGRGLAASGVLLVLAAGFGLWRTSGDLPVRAVPQTVRLVQPNAAQHLKWRSDLVYMFLDRQLAYTAAEPRPDLVIWPETAVPFLLNRDAGIIDEIASVAQGVPVIVGIQRTESLRGYNSLAVIAADGTVGAVYDKHHLVPFGEYIPLGDLAMRFGITAFAAQTGNGYSPGPGPRLLDLGAGLGRVLPLICYEAVFPADLRLAAGSPRPDWIVQITNDGWFGTLTGPWQHLAQARLRAVELGLPLVRAANTGVSAVIDARGRVVAQLGLGQAGYLDVALPAARPAPPYARWGDMPILGLLLMALVGLVARRRKACH